MAIAIPATQFAAVKQGTDAASRAPVQEVPVQEPAAGQILVKINWTGLCGSDKSLVRDEWKAYGVTAQPSCRGIAGHEGAGVVVALGPGVEETGLWKVGDRAGVKWISEVCGTCHFCKETEQGGEVLCVRQLNSGFTSPGTFQEYCAASAKYTTRIPDAVPDEEAGPIMCGGVTAYVAMKRSQAKPGEWIVLLGAGGGLGHMGVQFAKAMGLRIIAVDGGKEKGELCKKLGAEHYIDFTETKDMAAEVTRITEFGAHAAVVFSASAGGYASAPSLLRSGGTMVAVGLPPDSSVLAGASPLALCLKKLNIVGSVVGTLKDVDEALDFCARGLVHPVLTKGTMKDIDRLFDEMKKGTLVGRAVLKVAA